MGRLLFVLSLMMEKKKKEEEEEEEGKKKMVELALVVVVMVHPWVASPFSNMPLIYSIIQTLWYERLAER